METFWLVVVVALPVAAAVGAIALIGFTVRRVFSRRHASGAASDGTPARGD